DNITATTEGEHWAMNYVRYAEQNNIVPVGLYNSSNLDLFASRKEICYMLIQACRNIAYKPVLDNTDMKLDFADLNEENKEAINENNIDYAQAMRLCYAMGIITGYPDYEQYSYEKENGSTAYVYNKISKLVKPNENVTRAEAATMVARAYFAQYRQYTYIERTTEQLPSNASDFKKTFTYMPKSFYEEGKDSFFSYIPNKKPINFFSKYSLDDGRGKAKIEGAYDTLYNISYKMTDEQWELWKQEMQVFSNGNKLDVLNEYIQFIKENKIVIKGGYIVDTSTVGTVKSNLTEGFNDKDLIKGIGTLYIENPNNVDDISINQFEWYKEKRYINTSFSQRYVFFGVGILRVNTTNYIQNMDLYNYFYFSNKIN
ncbi:MAG: S-layer homology domain-containing protein, partial [Clostridiales bacterium]|nr:S-layer homology domain-containing protein [Clostridiales bacterium]